MVEPKMEAAGIEPARPDFPKAAICRKTECQAVVFYDNDRSCVCRKRVAIETESTSAPRRSE